jgi:hypothetical protein
VPAESELAKLPDDSEGLKALLRSLLLKHNSLHLEHLRENRRADDLHFENLQPQKELVQLKKLYCGPPVPTGSIASRNWRKPCWASRWSWSASPSSRRSLCSLPLDYTPEVFCKHDLLAID